MKKDEDFSEWYNNIIRDTKIIDDRYPIKGMPVYTNYGYFMIKKILSELEKLLDSEGFSAYWFPILIPYEIFRKESEHIKGFEKEVFYVKPSNPVEEEVETVYILRPTSETEMYYMFSLWIKSYRDLPLLTYMTNTVYRYETKATKPLIRGREILWNEAHTVHKDRDDAERMIVKSMEIYSKIFWEFLSIPHFWVMRPDWDKFAGADYTMAADTILPDGKFLQIGTTHLLGRNFSKAYNIVFEDRHPLVKIDKNKFESYDENGHRYVFEIDRDLLTITGGNLIIKSKIYYQGEISEDNVDLVNTILDIFYKNVKDVKLVNKKYVWQTSFGISMRTLAAVISIHGDDIGLILPFNLAPIQIVIIPIYQKEYDNSKILDYCNKIYNILKDKYRVKLDLSEDRTPGWKFNEYEKMGVPIRIEIGKKEVENNTVIVSVRKFNSQSQKYEIDFTYLLSSLENIISDYEKELKNRSQEYIKSKIIKIESLDELKNNLGNKLAFKIPFCMDEKCAENAKRAFSIDIRGIDYNNPEKADGKKCIFCGREAKYYVYAGKSY